MQFLRSFLPLILAFVLGAVLFAISREGWSVLAPITVAIQKVGITSYPLMILAAWAIGAGFFYAKLQAVTLEYIGCTAQRIGLLGTVIGLVTATLQIGNNLGDNASAAVSGALPAIGEALLSTAVGFIIALLCDFIAYLRFSNQEMELEQ